MFFESPIILKLKNEHSPSCLRSNPLADVARFLEPSLISRSELRRVKLVDVKATFVVEVALENQKQKNTNKIKYIHNRFNIIKNNETI